MKPLRASEQLDVRALRGELADMQARLAVLEILAAGCTGKDPPPDPELCGVTVTGTIEVEGLDKLEDRRDLELAPSPALPPPALLPAPDYNPVVVNDTPEDDDELAGAVAIAAERRAAVVKPAPKIDWNRVADAHARKAAEAKPAPGAGRNSGRALPVALDREECKRCGIPGWRGCDHQLPCEPPSVPAYRQEGRGPELTVDGRRRPGAR